jgi:DNA-binding transcriptional ArsR family regulator
MKTTEAVNALGALAQETRLNVFRLLVEQGPSGMAAGEIAETLGIAPAALSFHLKELAHARLVTARQDGRFIFYAADFAAMNRLLGFLTDNCCAGDGMACPPGKTCTPTSSPRKSRRKVKA